MLSLSSVWENVCLTEGSWLQQETQLTESPILHVLLCFVPQVAMVPKYPYPFPTVDIPAHAHYTIGSVILAIGITGMVGNFLVIYAFSR